MCKYAWELFPHVGKSRYGEHTKSDNFSLFPKYYVFIINPVERVNLRPCFPADNTLNSLIAVPRTIIKRSLMDIICKDWLIPITSELL